MSLSANPKATCGTASLAAVTLALGAPTVHADDVIAAPGTAARPGLERVVVTGTRARGLEASESLVPIQIVSADALQRVGGKPDLVEALAMLVPSFGVQAWGQDMSNQTLQARLRGLSPNHVLVLVDGKRRHTTANLSVVRDTYQGGAGADLNFIPVSAIDRIEVLTGGAAAQYGSDAVAGVINIILKKNSSGGTLDATYGRYFDGGGITSDVAGNFGLEPIDGSYLNLTAEVHNHGHSYRGGIAPSLVDPTVIYPASGATYPNTNIPHVPGWPHLNKLQGDAQYQLKLASFNSGFDLGGGAQLYALGTYGHKAAASYENYRLPAKVSYTDPTTGVTTYPFLYGFNPEEAITENDYALTGGIKGTLADWNCDLSSSYGNDNIEAYTVHSANAGLFSATDATPTNFYDGQFFATQWVTTLDLNRDLQTGLAGPLNVALGAEYRRETYKIEAGNPSSYALGGAQSFPGFTPTDAGIHDRKDYAGYIDLAAMPIAGLRLDAAGRHEHFSEFGNTTVVELTGRFDFTATFALRGTVSTGFRAPTLAEEYYSSTLVGPTSGFVQLPPNAPASRLLGLGGGLQPEKSTSYGLGFVFHPLPSMFATLDLYQIAINNRIVGSGRVYGTINGTPVSSVVTSAIVANGNVLDPQVVSTGSTGVTLFANGIDTRTRGGDLVFDFPMRYAWGNVEWSVGATYNRTAATKIPSTPAVLAGQPLYDATAISDLTTATPTYVIQLGALWSLGNVSINLRESIFGSSSEYENDDGDNAAGKLLYYKTTIGVIAITDLALGYQAGRNFKLSIGATNLFNRYPTQINGTVLAHERAHDDVQAVQIYPSFSPIGIDGGYYYAHASYRF